MDRINWVKKMWMLPVFLLMLASACRQSIDLKTGKCIAVRDGDTIVVLFEPDQPDTIRLDHIDCPERGQPFSRQAKKFTSDFCYDQVVRIESDGERDRYGRLIAVIFNEQGAELNAALVEAGLAWHYKRYSTDRHYDKLERAARKAGVGLWSQKDAVPPWAWRGR